MDLHHRAHWSVSLSVPQDPLYENPLFCNLHQLSLQKNAVVKEALECRAFGDSSTVRLDTK